LLQTRPDGTKIGAYLAPNGLYYDQATGASTTHNRSYLDLGPAAQRFGGQKLTDAQLKENHIGGGLIVNASLRSVDENTAIRTENHAWVATIVDPESLLVPEPPAEDGTKLHSVIGSEDPRFNAIMATVDALVNPATPAMFDNNYLVS